LSAGYDAFVAFVHGVPPFCHAKRSMLVVLFPVDSPPWPPAARGPLGALRRGYDAWEWRRRFASYGHRVAISQFALDWTRRRWSVECDVLHPPVGRMAEGRKERLLLSVSRFAPLKKQPELIAAFRDLEPALPAGWTFACAGGLDDSAESKAHFARAESAAAWAPVQFHCNRPRAELEALYGRASIFWHAMGYGEDLERFPERMEHFGIVTVEAMSAGCVPVVFDAGGQAEIVRHGIDGFRWKTLDELQRYTRRLATDDSLRGSMSSAAMERAAIYSKAGYLEAISRRIAA
jgi:glycosyltransferase involved in cell wall biosynthesis